MKSLIEIDKELTVINDNIKKLADEMSFQHIIDFDINISVDELNKIKKELKFKGVYFFEIKADTSIPYKEWINKFVDDWDREFPDLKNVPTTKLIRIVKHNEVKEWMPLYIGKRMDVGDRIEKHINLKFEATTVGIKFKIRQRFKDAKFRLSVLRLDVENYDSIVPLVETYLRNKIHPIVGKK